MKLLERVIEGLIGSDAAAPFVLTVILVIAIGLIFCIAVMEVYDDIRPFFESSCWSKQ